MKRILFFIAASVVLTGCQGLAIDEEVTDGYHLIAVDVDEQCALHENSCGFIIPQTVYAVGHNSSYIIAKQHPMQKTDKSKINYFIVPMHQIDRNRLFGPYTKGQFEEKRKELHIEDMQFSIVIEDLE